MRPGSPGGEAAQRTGFVRRLGDVAVLGARVLVGAATPPFAWWRQFLRESIFILRVSTLPLAFAVAVYAFGAPGIQGGGFLTEIGTIDRQGGFFVTGVIREHGIFLTSTFLAGIYGTTVTAELGARKIREELDALRVIGVDPLQHLVIPRVLAMTVMLSLFTAFLIVFGTVGGYVSGVVLYDSTDAAFWSTYFLNFSWIDATQGYVRALPIGFVIGLIFCHRGLSVEGGAEGVGRAVNQAIVGAMVATFLISTVCSFLLIALFPEVQALK